MVKPTQHYTFMRSPDHQAWSAFKAGNTVAFQNLYEDHAEAMFSYGMKLDPNRDRVKDCMHDTFLELWERREHLSDLDQVRPYLFTALRRKIFRAKSRLSRLRFYASDPDTDFPLEFQVSPEMLIIEEEVKEQKIRDFQKAVNQLTGRQREILYLKYRQGFQHEEISEMLNISKQSVSNSLYKATQKIKSIIPQSENILPLFPLLFLHLC